MFTAASVRPSNRHHFQPNRHRLHLTHLTHTVNMTESQNKKDLTYARTKVSFDVQDMTNYLHGGAANVEQRRYIIDLIAREPIFNKDDW